MKVEEGKRGFAFIQHKAHKFYESREMINLIQESSAVGDSPDSLARPGSSFLWVGKFIHLAREEVVELVEYLEYWLETGHLPRENE